jgi:hypothetical protein
MENGKVGVNGYEAGLGCFDDLIVTHHYLQLDTLMGENLRYVANWLSAGFKRRMAA